MGTEAKRILIIKPSALGDIVLALPALSALRRSFPDAHISWLVRPAYAGLLEKHPHLDEVIAFDRKHLGKAWYSPRAFAALWSLVAQLRRSKFDAVIDLQGLLRTGVLAWLCGAKRRYGMAAAREWATIFYTHKTAQDADCIHLVDYYLRIVKHLGATDVGVEFVLPHDEQAAHSVEKLLAEHQLKPGSFVVFVPGSVHADKRWPIERFGVLAEKIAADFDLPTVAVGACSEVNLAEQLKMMSAVPVTNLAGRTTLPELIELLRKARLVASNDTGPGHVAAALGVPLVIKYSWSNPARIAPYGRPECMVARDPYDRGLAIRSPDPGHLVANITAEEVYARVREQLGAAAHR